MGARPKQLTPDKSARHMFGAKLRHYREAAGLSLEALAQQVASSRSQLSRIESAEQMVPPELPALLDELFGTPGTFKDLYALARREIHPDQFRRQMDLEARAHLIEQYAGQAVPGFVQIEGYARAQFELSNPKAPTSTIDDLVAARMSRQTLLRDSSGPDYSLILDEAAISRSFGGSAVMREQLSRLADLTSTPRTVVQLLPFSHGGHALVNGVLKLMTLGDGVKVVYEEGISTGTLLEDEASVIERQRAYDLLRACALSPQETREFILSVMEELEA
ncbi:MULTISPECIES: helix-turn-helix transcriptional regulator [unclassified Streptomyces]|uniref:helix-turn-helix domain-containing protein n=1 Tax=unclassified Streptomyces TaxID=2593676 RepID=UPI000CD59D00|nr:MULTISPECIES: helix-turn-helix transcriptional regulator [unclassified Streptomyces]